ncbi:MAG: hypothetical protein ACRESR_02660, partial [Gammaproteobacteria bacterium]
MDTHRKANVFERAMAAALNLPFGSLPIAIPNGIYDYVPAHAIWARNINLLDGVAAGLALFQMAFVYK